MAIWLLAWSLVFVGTLVMAHVGTTRRAAQDRDTLTRLKFALEDFYLDTTRYPRDDEGYAALISSDPDMDGTPIDHWTGPYLDLRRVRLLWSSAGGEITDMGGHPVYYHADEDQRQVYLLAPGPNGRLDTGSLGTAEFPGLPAGDDILVWVEGPAMGADG